MTMIAFTLNYNVPFVVGDLLFTSEKTKDGITLPTQAYDLAERLSDSEAVPVELLQKIYILKPNLCLALAGDSSKMQDFLEELKIRCKYYGDWEMTKDIVMQFLNDFGLKANFQKSAFCFMLLEGEPSGFQDIEIGHPPEAWKILENDLFEKVYVCGSGNEPYLRRIQVESKHKSSHRKGDFFFAIQNNINLFARILAEEKSTSHTTKDGWGGGFETIYFNGESFVKFENLTYIVFQGEYINENGDLGELSPTLIMHYKYYDDTLLITSIDISGGRAEVNDLDTHYYSVNISVNHFKIGTLYKDYVESGSIPIDKSFTNERIAVGFALRTQTGWHSPAFYTEKDGAKVDFSQKNNQITISLKSEMLSEVRRVSKEVFHNLVTL